MYANHDSELVRRAFAFAKAAHEAVGQMRKYTGEPYIVHPVEVADIVQTVAHTEVMLAAALLHDTVEDTGVTTLPQRVAFAVFKQAAILTPLVNHGRKASVTFMGNDCGFVDSLGEAGLRQAHLAEVNNALYANTAGAPEFAARPLPTRAAVLDYPELQDRFPEAFARAMACVE